MDLHHRSQDQLSLDAAHQPVAPHQHSPHQNPNHNANPSPNPNPNPNLRPSSSAAFKRDSRRQRRERKRQEKRQQLLLQQLESFAPLSKPTLPSDPHTPTSSSVPWPCNPDPVIVPDTTSWALPKPITRQPQPPASAEELSRIATAQAQQNGLRTCREFLSNYEAADDDEEEYDTDGDEGELGMLDFFAGLFDKDVELRDFYERNWEKGEFCCLVCEGMGVKMGKRFVNVSGLVQHCSSISRTKTRGAHRAFGNAICRVFRWGLRKAAHPEERIQDDGIIEKEAQRGVGETFNANHMDIMDST